MSKIDLSKAKIGDKFRTKNGQILEYVGEDHFSRFNDKYLLANTEGLIKHFFQYGKYLVDEGNDLDLVEQVFDDEKDRAITDKILKDVEEVVNGVAGAMPLIESSAIANLPHEPLPENNEDDAELQRRQKVVELAEKMYIMFENETLRSCLSSNGSKIDCSKALMEKAIIRAASFINMKQKYLKEGKL